MYEYNIIYKIYLALCSKKAEYRPRRLGMKHIDKKIYIIGESRSDAIGGGIFAFYSYVLTRLAVALRRGLIPVVDMRSAYYMVDPERGSNPWDYYFEQPHGISLQDALESNCVYQAVKISSWESETLGSQRFLNGTSPSFVEYCDLAKGLIRFRPDIKERLEEEWNALYPGSGEVLAVLSRGTDYKKLKPSRHHIQPSVEYLIDRAKRMIDSNSAIKYIFLKTEERSVVERFRDIFSSMLLCFTGHEYFDGYEPIDHGDDPLNHNFLPAYIMRHGRRSQYHLNLEYIQNIYAASKCHHLIAGINNGTIGAVVMNDRQYIQKEIIDLGRYE